MSLPEPRPVVILIHGATNSAGVWQFWQDELASLGWQSYAVDLRGHGAGPAADLSVTTMRDYADDVASAAQRLDSKPIVIGWSMGGLVDLMLAERGLSAACVGLAPSAPTRVLDKAAPLRPGVFESQECADGVSCPQ